MQKLPGDILQLISEYGNEKLFEIIRLILIRRSREESEYLLDYNIARRNFEKNYNKVKFVENFKNYCLANLINSGIYQILRVDQEVTMNYGPLTMEPIPHHNIQEDFTSLIIEILKKYKKLPIQVIYLLWTEKIEFTEEFVSCILSKTLISCECKKVYLDFIKKEFYTKLLQSIEFDRLLHILQEMNLESFLIAIDYCTKYKESDKYIEISLQFEEILFERKDCYIDEWLLSSFYCTLIRSVNCEKVQFLKQRIRILIEYFKKKESNKLKLSVNLLTLLLQIY